MSGYWWAISLLVFLLLLSVAFWFFPIRTTLPLKVVPADKVRLITRKHQQDATDLQALIIGRLWVVDGCVKIGESTREARTAIWRSGYRVGEDAMGIFVYHPDSHTRHRIGEKVRFGGGYIENLDPEWVAQRIEEPDLMRCPGPFIFVDSTGD